jgi:signal transduction histidine kinase
MTMETDNLRRLLDIGRSLVTELEPEAVLQRILAEAKELTGASYVALGVLNEERTELERFLTLGIGPRQQAVIGDLPRGRGVLGVLIQDPQPLRLTHVGGHPQSYGFPAGHPSMESFLGVPVRIRGETWGNLYLTDKRGYSEFTDEDEAAVMILADLAATAIDNARQYARSEQRRLALEQAVQGLEAARDIADAIGAAEDIDGILELVVKRGRALVEARSVLILLRQGAELVVAATAGHALGALGRRVPVSGSTSGGVLERGIAERIGDVGHRLRISPELLGVPESQTALLVPMVHEGQGLGVLAAFDRGEGAEQFTADDERLLRTFAASAANAVAISRSVEAGRLRSALDAAEAERARWARELHDQTLQSLAALKVGLSAALRRDDVAAYAVATRQAISDIDQEIANLRAIIADLRPSSLDDLGLAPALEALLERRRGDGLEIECELDLPAWLDGASRETQTLETVIYRVIQETLTNVVKHAHAGSVEVSVAVDERALLVEVRDDGHGFDVAASTLGFGLAGMRERVFLLGGTLTVQSTPQGTLVQARLPLPETAGVTTAVQ